MKFTNWKNPSIRQPLREYKIEHEMKGNKFWKDKRDFVNSVKQAKVESITPEGDSAIGYRSRTKDKKQLLGLIKGYRSYPKFRNEDTLNSIYQGYAKNNPMDRPIVVESGGRRRVFSGNTRMDAAYHSGVNPEVLVVKASQLSARLRLRELAAASLRLIEMGYTKPGLRDRIKARIKREGARRGEQFVKQPDRIAKKTARHR